MNKRARQYFLFKKLREDYQLNEIVKSFKGKPNTFENRQAIVDAVLKDEILDKVPHVAGFRWLTKQTFGVLVNAKSSNGNQPA